MNKGLFKPQVMYFGLCNSPETFQRMINSIFWELLYKGVLANYMNDFVIPAEMKEQLEERTIQFLKIAEKHNLCFKRSKYDFNIEEIPIPRSYSWKGPSKDETGENQSCKRIENSNQSQRYEKLPWICKFLPMLYPELQSYSKTIE